MSKERYHNAWLGPRRVAVMHYIDACLQEVDAGAPAVPVLRPRWRSDPHQRTGHPERRRREPSQGGRRRTTGEARSDGAQQITPRDTDNTGWNRPITLSDREYCVFSVCISADRCSFISVRLKVRFKTFRRSDR